MNKSQQWKWPVVEILLCCGHEVIHVRVLSSPPEGHMHNWCIVEPPWRDCAVNQWICSQAEPHARHLMASDQSEPSGPQRKSRIWIYSTPECQNFWIFFEYVKAWKPQTVTRRHLLGNRDFLYRPKCCWVFDLFRLPPLLHVSWK